MTFDKEHRRWIGYLTKEVRIFWALERDQSDALPGQRFYPFLLQGGFPRRKQGISCGLMQPLDRVQFPGRGVEDAVRGSECAEEPL
jgi:hypothetical protein